MRRPISIVLLLACGLLLLGGIVQLFELRFETGDIYPEYSSLRADPLGTMALYETLNDLPGVAAIRDYSDGNELPTGPHTVYLHLASSSEMWKVVPEELFLEIERFTRTGGRLVITFFPTPAERSTPRSRRALKEKPAGPKKAVDKADPKKANGKSHKNDLDPMEDKEPGKEDDKSKPADKKKVDRDIVPLDERWGLHVSHINLEEGDDETYRPVRVTNRTALNLPPSLDWHSGAIFTNLGPAWTPIYMRGANPVVIERTLGQGSVVFSTDSYFISNEAMLQDRHADFLAWLVGPNQRVYFDEAHLGLIQSTGIAMLMRQYRLQGFLAGVALLAGLFLWKNATSLAPLPATAARSNTVAGKEAYSGFVNLLRRNVSQSDLLATCFEVWKKSAGRGGGCPAARRKAAEDAYTTVANAKDPVKAYQAISAALHTAPAPIQPSPPVLNTSHES